MAIWVLVQVILLEHDTKFISVFAPFEPQFMNCHRDVELTRGLLFAEPAQLCIDLLVALDGVCSI